MKNIAIIPARGGSKRIHRKNVKPFLGKPIIAYSIEAAIQSQLFDEVIVSTEDEEIAEIAVKYGASVPFKRSEANSGDYATTFNVIEEVILEYRKRNIEFKYGCCIYATAPLIKVEHLQEGLQMLKDKKFASVFPVVPFGYPVWRGLELQDNNSVKMLWPEYQNSRSQDLKRVYHDAGQWYWFNSEEILREGKLFTSNSGALHLEETEVQDIDNHNDWAFAEFKYMKFFEKEKSNI